jgi:glycosyltransferase involved in cell wall biosynthesis
VAALSRAMLALVDDRRRRELIGARGRELVRTRFSIDVMAAELIKHLDELIAAR